MQNRCYYILVILPPCDFLNIVKVLAINNFSFVLFQTCVVFPETTNDEIAYMQHCAYEEGAAQCAFEALRDIEVEERKTESLPHEKLNKLQEYWQLKNTSFEDFAQRKIYEKVPTLMEIAVLQILQSTNSLDFWQLPLPTVILEQTSEYMENLREIFQNIVVCEYKRIRKEDLYDLPIPKI